MSTNQAISKLENAAFGVSPKAESISPPGARRIKAKRGQAIIGILFSVLFFLTFLAPIFATTIGTKFAWGCFCAWAFVVIPSILQGSKSLRVLWKNWIAFGVWIIVISINVVLERGGSDAGIIHLIVAISTLMAAIMGAVIGTMPAWVRRAMLTTFLVILGIQAYISLPTLFFENGISRDLMDRDTSAILEKVFYAKRGVGDFHLYTGLAILTPALLGIVLFESWRYRIILGFFLIGILGSIILSTFSAAVFLALLGTVILVGGILWSRGFIGMIMLYAVVMGVLAVSLTLLSELQQVDRVSSKLERLFEGVSTAGIVDGDETGRGYLASISLDTFLAEPTFGVGSVSMGKNSPLLYVKVGGHSSWIDQLAEYGIFGFGPFLVFIFLLIRQAIWGWRRSRKITDAGVCISAFSFAILGFVNPAVFVDSIAVPVVFFLSMVSSADISSQLGGGSNKNE